MTVQFRSLTVNKYASRPFAYESIAKNCTKKQHLQVILFGEICYKIVKQQWLLVAVHS